MTTKDKIDFEELEAYRPWTLDEVPIGSVLGIWVLSSPDYKWVFVGRCLIVGARQIYNDTNDFVISLGSSSRCGSGIKEVYSQETLLNGEEHVQYRIYTPLDMFSSSGNWLPCGVKKVKEVGITVAPDKKSKKIKVTDDRCECKKNCWCSADLRVDSLTGHSSTCPNVTTRLMMDKTQELLKELTKGIEAWASDEDGVHTEIWKAYVRAKTIIGEAHTIGKES